MGYIKRESGVVDVQFGEIVVVDNAVVEVAVVVGVAVVVEDDNVVDEVEVVVVMVVAVDVDEVDVETVVVDVVVVDGVDVDVVVSSPVHSLQTQVSLQLSVHVSVGNDAHLKISVKSESDSSQSVL